MRRLITHDEIVSMAKSIGDTLSDKYRDAYPVVVGVLKGAVPFHSELIKHMDIDMEVDYMHVSSYSGTASTGVVTFNKDIDTDILDRDVIIVEDIVDTGLTLSRLDAVLKARKPRSITYVTMLDKPSKRKVDFTPDYIGRSIDDLFVIGFGLDLDGKYRNLQDVYVYDED